MINAVFCDFDGTVARRDIGYNLYHHFSNGRNDEVIPDWKAGRLSTRDCLRLEASMVTASPEEVYSFLDQFELNRGFVEFTALCRANRVPLTVLSEGLDFYIDYLLERHGVSGIPVHTNVGCLENGSITVKFPQQNRHCKRCGNCKGERIEDFRAAAAGPVRAIFVGDGYSDACATREADIIFAKKDLEEYCRTHHIEFYEYDDFFDVAGTLEELGCLNR
ncbi:MAG: MtnX-like HAD-IB family phosphatase [candidate division Zixibacteria bacterium]|nr:MtnX-like HAD-IB family phosphatase [candidate division Zixibacteria bacterium]